MPYCSSISWSTKHETEMDSTMKQDSEMNTSFRTPSARVGFDGNNNLAVSGEKAVNIVQESYFGRSPVPPMVCDDCGFQRHDSKLRWCDDCAAAICDACVLDRHTGHCIMLYQTAYRKESYKLNEVIRKGGHEKKIFAKKYAELRQFHREINAKMDHMKSKIERRAKDSGDLYDQMRREYETLSILVEMPLTGKTACERRHAMRVARAMAETLTERQMAIGEQMVHIKSAISEMQSGIKRDVGE